MGIMAKGMHMCTYCMEAGDFDNQKHVYSYSSSGDITLVFPNGDIFEMPDMILHYVFDHKWLPPQVFIDDVLRYDVGTVTTERLQTKGMDTVNMKIGYLQGQFEAGYVTEEFKEKLVLLIEKAAADYPWMVAPKKQGRGE